MSLLDGKVAFITGAASGIGREIALAFAHQGAKIAIADVNSPAAAATAAEIKDSGTHAIGLMLDVTDEAQVETAVQATVKAFGNIDILISNAGIQIVHPIVEFSFTDWKKMLAIHLDGAFLTTRACMKQMIASNTGGSIIYMGSVHSKEASLLKAPRTIFAPPSSVRASCAPRS
jgi:3-hydroxybutyrate dehydrogenase